MYWKKIVVSYLNNPLSSYGLTNRWPVKFYWHDADKRAKIKQPSVRTTWPITQHSNHHFDQFIILQLCGVDVYRQQPTHPVSSHAPVLNHHFICKPLNVCTNRLSLYNARNTQFMPCSLQDAFLNCWNSTSGFACSSHVARHVTSSLVSLGSKKGSAASKLRRASSLSASTAPARRKPSAFLDKADALAALLHSKQRITQPGLR